MWNYTKIITQKWIAGFPEGQEAWSDYRRTGYPKLLPVPKQQAEVISSQLSNEEVCTIWKDGNLVE
jgi:hypothetical protein